VVKHNGTYYMTYSANMHNLPVYGIGVATAQHPLGPWTKFEGNPIVATDPSTNLVAPGHSSIARAPDGTELFMVYHRHEEAVSPDGSPVVSPRLVCIDRFFFDADGNLLLKGPTRTPQPMPSGRRHRVRRIREQQWGAGIQLAMSSAAVREDCSPGGFPANRQRHAGHRL
jgi:hypothetical protein